jgi:integrase
MRTDKRSIAIDDIARLRHILLPPSFPLAFSRDIFLFCFYALGMPFVDVAFLQKQQCKDGYIVYDRHKTGQRVRVRIEPLMQQIIDRYSREDSIYVFPILTASDRDAREKEYESVRSRYNRHLRKLGEMMGLGRRLTSYVARHSWASIAYHANVDLSVISKALGHTSPNTTLTYIREIDDNRIDMANKELLDRLML